MSILTAQQYKDWVTYYKIDPWGEEQRFFQTGLICSVISNNNANRKRGSKAAKPSEYIPVFDYIKPKMQDVEDMKAVFMTMPNAKTTRNKK